MLEYTIFPNPSKGDIIISIDAERNTLATVTVFDMTGKAQHLQPVKLITGTNAVTMYLNTLEPGLYIAEIESKAGVQKKPLIITH